MSREMVKHIVNRWPTYWHYPYMVLGNFAHSTKKERWILDAYATEYNGEIETPGYHFNKILTDYGIRFARSNNAYTDLSYPYKAIPGPIPYAFYVDISRAYAQIANVYGPEVVIKEGGYVGYGTTKLPQIFEENKLIRALLIGATYPETRVTEWKNGNITTRKYRNRNNAPNLRRAIIGTLHAIQSEISPYTVYCHTDGFIVPVWHMERVTKKLDTWGLSYSIKGEGATVIYGVGSYRIGPSSTTRHYSTRYKERECIRHEYSEWYKRIYTRKVGR